MICSPRFFLSYFSSSQPWLRSLACALVLSPWSALADDSNRDVAPVSPKEFSVTELPGLEEECLSALEDKSRLAETIAKLEGAYPEGDRPEAIRMLLAILNGSRMGLGEGWFSPAKQAYDWKWMAARHDLKPGKSISRFDFLGESEQFDRLDRNGDGDLGEDDLDWDPSSPYMEQVAIANVIFRKIDKTQDARVSRAELMAFFERARGEDDEMSIDAFRRALALGAKGSGGFFPGDAPSPDKLIRGFFSKEIGSWQHGPRPGTMAPDFELTTQDGRATIRLKDWIGKKPVVLIFGNFTCGPFRRTYPDFDEISRRFADEANFFGVYVREAHPADGWLMESNTRMGVRLDQPKNMEERVAVAQTCATKLNYSMPLLVDTMDDEVGNLYSGMPARAYVIGVDGRVTYQGGRGPYGFRPAEMEQSLIMTLMADKPE